jgi:hypothetical protein
VIKAATLFGFLGFLSALPIVWFFYGAMLVSSLPVWVSVPVLAFITSALSAFLVGRRGTKPHLGVARGIVAALIALLVCSLVYGILTEGSGFFIIVISTFFWCGWFIAILGGVAGSVCQRYVLAKL